MMLTRNIQRILAYRHPVDMRRQFDGLIGLVRNVLREDPLSGSLFLFRNRRGNYIKGVFWDRTGFFLIAKRLEHGRFHLSGNETTQELSVQQFELFLDGIMLGHRKRSAVQTKHDAARTSHIAEP